MGGLAIKLTGMSIQGGEYFFNTTRGVDEGENDLTAFTVDALFQPNDDFDFRVILDYIDDETPTRPCRGFIVNVIQYHPEVEIIIGLEQSVDSECRKIIFSFVYAASRVKKVFSALNTHTR